MVGQAGAAGPGQGNRQALTAWGAPLAGHPVPGAGCQRGEVAGQRLGRDEGRHLDIDAGITANTVNPGPVDTGYVTEADREATAVMFPQGRWGEPDDAARLITWLLTDEARWITGQVINSEGGFARWRR